MHVVAQDVVHRGAFALVGHQRGLGLGQFELRVHQLRHAAVAAVAQLVGVGAGIGQQLLHVLGGQAGRAHHHVDVAAHQRHRRKALDGVVRRVLLQQRHLHHRRVAGQKEGVAVGLGARHQIAGNGAIGTGPVVHQHRLAPRGRERLRQDARHRIGGAARRKLQHDAHRLARPGLGQCGQAGAGQSQAQQEWETPHGWTFAFNAASSSS